MGFKSRISGKTEVKFSMADCVLTRLFNQIAHAVISICFF